MFYTWLRMVLLNISGGKLSCIEKGQLLSLGFNPQAIDILWYNFLYPFEMSSDSFRLCYEPAPYVRR